MGAPQPSLQTVDWSKIPAPVDDGGARHLRVMVAGQTLIKRLALIMSDGRIEAVLGPVFPPDRHAADVLSWLRTHAA